jgi:hypothetical protein
MELKFTQPDPYQGIRTASRQIVTPELLAPAGAFSENVLRLDAILRFPLQIIVLTGARQECISEARIDVLGSVRGPISGPADLVAVRARADELWKMRLSKEDPLSYPYRDDVYAQSALRIMTDIGDPDFLAGLRAILVTQITGTWTAFEVLAADLWEAALNAHPETLSALSAFAAGGQPKSGRDQEKTIALSEIGKHRFDLTSKMGTVLREKFNFQRLSEIVRAYQSAFDDINVRSAISSQDLKALSEVRHVFVHRAGVADQDFVHEVRNIATLNHISIGDPISVDGEFIEKIVTPAVEAALHLIEAVDEWIIANPQKS